MERPTIELSRTHVSLRIIFARAKRYRMDARIYSGHREVCQIHRINNNIDGRYCRNCHAYQSHIVRN